MAGYFSAATFRTIGSTVSPQVIMTIENIDATKLVYVRRATLQMDATAVLTSVMPLMKTARTTAVPTGGTTLSKALFDTANTSNANTIVRGACSTDGGALSGPTATAGTVVWEQFAMRMHTVVGQVLAPDNSMLPVLCDTQDFVLRQNEALMFYLLGTAAPATNHYFCEVVWEEN